MNPFVTVNESDVHFQKGRGAAGAFPNVSKGAPGGMDWTPKLPSV